MGADSCEQCKLAISRTDPPLPQAGGGRDWMAARDALHPFPIFSFGDHRRRDCHRRDGPCPPSYHPTIQVNACIRPRDRFGLDAFSTMLPRDDAWADMTSVVNFTSVPVHFC